MKIPFIKELEMGPVLLEPIYCKQTKLLNKYRIRSAVLYLQIFLCMGFFPLNNPSCYFGDGNVSYRGSWYDPYRVAL